MKNTDNEDLQEYIYEHIPVIKRNAFTIKKDSSNMVVVGGSFKDHINHRNSVFVGSLSSALILTAWANVRNILLMNDIKDGVIVIQSEEVSFKEPVIKDFIASTSIIPDDQIKKFIKMLYKFGKSRLPVKAIITHDHSDAVLATFIGDFVVVLKRK